MEVIKILTKWVFFFLFILSSVIFTYVKTGHISVDKEIAISIPSVTPPVGWKTEEVESYKLPPGPIYEMSVVLSSTTGGTIYTVKGSKSLFFENKEGKRAAAFIGLSEEEKTMAQDELIKVRGQKIEENPKRIVYKVKEYSSSFWKDGLWAINIFVFFVIWVLLFSGITRPGKDEKSKIRVFIFEWLLPE
jgi:hypothetical protein